MDLPLPIARLLRRARNEKSPKGRHDTAYFAWEASLRVAVAAEPPADVQPLRVPSTGDWARAMAADDTPAHADELLAAYALMTEVGTGKASRPRSVTMRRLADIVPAYRNQVIGHGSTRSATFYDDGFEILSKALTRAWADGLFWSESVTLVHVESVSVAPDGGRRARVFDLSGVASTVIDARGGTPVPDDILPHRLYLRDGDSYRSLYPWLLFQEDERGERVWFFNGRKRRPQYLDYVSGAALRGKQLTAAFPEVAQHLDVVLTTSAPALADDSEPEDAELYGDYRIQGKLGAGGMGVVYEAVHESLGRRVALKTLPPAAADDPIALARFQREIAALAQCEHPNIVKILDSGAARDTYYYVMELVEGQHLGAAQLSDGRDGANHMRTVATLFRDAAAAVQHLHDLGILHRDIKPQNLMVTDSDQRVVVMDLGLAAVGDASQSLTLDKGSILGTLRYMPAEQLQRNLLRLDRRADVYSLGSTFYEVFTGTPFFDGDSEVRLIQQVLHEQPVDPLKANSQVPADIATILRKATEKDPRLRYDSAEALQNDISAFLAGEPISARPPTLGYLLGLAIRRHKALALAIVAALVAALVGGGLFVQRERTVAAQQRALRESAEQARDMAEANLATLLEEQGRSAMLAGDRKRALAYLSASYSRGRDTVALRHLMTMATRDLTPLVHTLGPVDTRFFSVAFAEEGTIATIDGGGIIGLWSGTERATAHETGIRVHHGQLSEDGRWAAIISLDDQLSMWRVEDGQRMWETPYEAFLMARMRFDIGAEKLLVIDGKTESARVWDVATGALIATLTGHEEQLYDALFSPDGELAITCSEDGTARVYSTVDFSLTATLSGGLEDITSAAFSPGGRYVVTGSWDRIARVWELPEGKLRYWLTSHYDRISAVAWSENGEMIATADQLGGLRVWDVRGNLLSQARDHAGELSLLSFSPDSTLLVGAGEDHRMHIWDAASLARLTSEVAHQSGARALAFDPRGPRVATVGSWDGAVRVWTTKLGSMQARVPGREATWSGNGQRVITSNAGVLHAWEPGTGNEVATLDESAGLSLHLLADMRGQRVLSYGFGDARVYDFPRKAHVATMEHGHSAVISPAGDLVATVDIGDSVKLWDAASGGLRHTVTLAEESPLAAAISPGSDKLAVAYARAPTRVWSTDTGKQLYTARADGDPKPGSDGADALPEPEEDADNVAFAPDGGVLIAFGNHAPKVIDADSGAVLARLVGHTEKVVRVAFSRDGRRAVTDSEDKSARVWELPSGALIASAAGAVASAISADGARFATGAEDGAVRVYDAATGKLLSALRGHRQQVVGLGFSADGQQLSSHSKDGTVVIWDIHLESRSIEQIAELAEMHAPWQLRDGQLVGRPLAP